MKSKLGMVVAGLTLLIGAVAFGPVASAGCADAAKPRKASVVMNPLWQGQGDKGDRGKEESEPIVGLWRMNLIAEGDSAFGFKDGDIFDAGIAQWHEDGTELLNSSRVPDTQSFCMGIWKKTSHLHYRLNHFAKSWQNGVFLGPAQIQEEVVVGEDGNGLSGTWTVDQYDTSGNLLAHLAGKIEAKRLTADSTIKDVL
jgi:hypothetical protein